MLIIRLCIREKCHFVKFKMIFELFIGNYSNKIFIKPVINYWFISIILLVTCTEIVS